MLKLKKLVALLLCFVMLSSVVLTSCDSGDSGGGGNQETSQNTPSDTSGNQTGSTGQHTHTSASAVTEKLVDSTCTTMGSYDEVVYCSTCNEEISRTPKIIEKKNHDYNQRITTDIYLKAEAGCVDRAVYYYSCSCGAKGDTTFTDGEANGHSYVLDWEKDAIHHWHKANCEHTSEISEKIEHDYGTDNICDICEYVRGIAVSGITLNYTSFAAMVGDVKSLVATITPDDATNKKVMWTTSNSAVITVDENGVVTAVGAGNAIVYAITEDGTKMAQCIVVVIDNTCSHTTTRTERENEIDSTCKEVGSYDEVVYCSACGDELSRTQKEIAKKETHTPITDARVEPTFTETGLTEGSHCGVCGFVIVAQEVIPVKPSKSDLLSENLTVNATNISGKVSYATTEFNFANDISVTNSGTWVLSTDVNGVHTIITKKAPLSEGNNVFYIHVENPDKSVTTYTVNIYRNHIYTVSFDTDGGTGVEPQYVEEGYLATAPSTNKTGYAFVSWNYDFDTPITANITIKANWNANTGTAYRVEYYLENATKNGYDIVSAETENLTGTTDTTANAEQKTFTHFTLNASKSTLSGNIKGDGSLVLEVYYTRNSYTVSTNRNNTKGGTVTSGGTYAYDTEIALTATTNAGYTFLGWFEGNTKVCDSLTYIFKVDHTATYTAKWSANTNTAYTVEYYLENVDKNGYDIVSSETENLTGTTDTTANAEQKTFTHFTLNTSNSTLSGNINGDGNLVLKVYYTRNAYSVNSDDTSIGTVSNGGSYGYNKQITVSASVSKLGYTFVGWYSGEDLLSSDSEYTFNIDKNVVAKFDVAEEMKNFNFTSTSTTCTITGVKDKTIITITIPNYVTSFGDYAFYYSSSLAIVYYSGSVDDWLSIYFSREYSNPMYYADKIYFNNEPITQITISNTVTQIPNYAFYNFKELTNISIGDGITNIGECAFYNCTALRSIIVPDSVISIGAGAFIGCSSLTSITIGNSVTSIGMNAFKNCTSISRVNYTGDIESWLKISFGGNSNPTQFAKDLYLNNLLVTEIIIPDTITEIPSYAFYSCKSIRSVTIGDTVTSIANHAFYGCTNLTSITIPNSVISIGKSAFYNCTNIKSVVLGSSVISISNFAFGNCNSLSKVYYLGSPSMWDSISISDNNNGIYASRYYYSEERPTDTTYRYWRYVDGVPTPWENN